MRGPLLYLFSYISGNAEMIEVIVSFFSVFVIIFLVFPFREFARAWVATQLGGVVAELRGNADAESFGAYLPEGRFVYVLMLHRLVEAHADQHQPLP